MLRYCFLILSIALFLSCKTKNVPLRQAVLSHYSEKPEDSVKLKAATFLLDNMQGLKTIDPASVSKNQPFFAYMEYLANKVAADSAGKERTKVPDDLFAKGMDSVVTAYSDNGKKPVFAPLPRFFTDADTLDAGFIIDNIDKAFDAWKKMPWARQLSFPVFCEYLLPYRASDTYWDSTRVFFTNKYKYLADSFPNEQNLITVGEAIRKEIHTWFKEDGTFSDNYPFLKPLPFEQILKGRHGDCYEATMLRVSAMRSMGVPAAFEMVPQWGNVSSGNHFFYKVIDPAHDTITAKIDNANVYRDTRYIVEGSSYEEKLAWTPANINITYNKSVPKIYRRCFAIQDSSLARRKLIHESIPPLFANDRLQDVTAQYVETADVTIELPQSKDRFAYLCVFNPKGWEPVAWAEVIGNKAVFRNMGKNIVYLPAFYNEGLIPASAAFLLQLDGTVQPLLPSKTKQQMALTRKFRISTHNVGNAMQCTGARFQGANDPAFGDTVNLYTIRDVRLDWTKAVVNNSRPFRYVLFRFDSSHKSAIAEMEVWGMKDGKNVKLQGTPVGNPGTYKNSIKNAFDTNKLSYFMYDPGKMNYIGLDLGDRYTITEIRYCPRNDDNNISGGNLYELFYWDGRWISLGTQIGKELSPLMYTAPANALYWLRNKTKGKEERIFTYRNGQQVFW
jgi:hypothetical protein